MPEPTDIDDAYYEAWIDGDLDKVRSLLHDDLSFRGPIDTFDNADDYMDALRRLAPAFQGMRKTKVLVDGDDICTIYDFIGPPPIETQPIAEWHRVRGDRIEMIRLFFDPRPFAPPSTRQPPRDLET
jgi:hypothetical protein